MRGPAAQRRRRAGRPGQTRQHAWLAIVTAGTPRFGNVLLTAGMPTAAV